MKEQGIFALSPDDASVFNWNVDANLLCGDTHFAEIFGLDKQAVLEGLPIETYLASVWEGDRRSVAKTLHHAISTGGSCFQDYHVLRPDGSMVHVVGIGRCFRDIKNEATRYVGVVFDDVELDDIKKKQLFDSFLRKASEPALALKPDNSADLITHALNKLEQDGDTTKDRNEVVYH